MNIQEEFMAKIAENPLDELQRHVYADWLIEHDQPEEAERQRQWVPAEKWLRQYAMYHKHYDAHLGEDKVYEILIQEAKNGEIFYHGGDLHGPDGLYDGEELFRCLKIVLGYHVDKNAFTYSCSC